MPRFPALPVWAALTPLAVACTHHPEAINGPPRVTSGGYFDEAWATGEPGSPYRIATRTIREPETSYSARFPYLESETPPPSDAYRTEGDPCLRDLERAGTKFRKLPELAGVETPVEVLGTLGGVRYWTEGGTLLRMDCRLAVTLSRLGPTLAKKGVSAVRYSGAYVYRTTASGRLSHHAHGLAIDLHEFTIAGTSRSVDRDFARNAGCQSDVPELNRLACDLRTLRLFDEFLTPDYNADHRDHLHVSVPR